MTPENSIDYASCPRCGLSTPIRRSMFSSTGTYQSWTKTDGLPEFFLCRRCNRIVCFPALGLEPRQPIGALSHRHGNDSLRLFESPIECAAEGCNTHATLYIAWDSLSDDEPNANTARKWALTDFVCLKGHRFPLPWEMG